MINHRLLIAEEINKDPELRKRLEWYFLVLEKKVPSKINIAIRIPVEERLEELAYEELWRLHEEKSKEFKELKEEVLDKGVLEKNIQERSYLDLKIEIVKRIVKSCILCERRCKVDREREIGFCRVDKTRLSEYFLHYGEELPLIPSGTIFFTGCNFKCVYCQNWSISQYPENGEEVNYIDLANIQEKLHGIGAKNINWVGGEPTPNLLDILKSMKEVAERDINIPQLWNSNMYLTEESMKVLLDVIDIWLPDFKYGNNQCALKYSFVPNYFEIITRNLLIIKGESIIIRHLVLPEHIECCSKRVLEWIANNLPEAVVNIMDQYHPDYLVLSTDKYPEIKRRVSEKEMLEVYRYADSLGLYWREISLY
ncbi:4Fe-4S cluster-binding domain-containing protein [Nanoarchaeota archaeon NZ13-N]|nr:MAG: 4Fe-4S cluster-binding domain-containing protein [Nanoarchaeota archaeon NZ13-N]